MDTGTRDDDVAVFGLVELADSINIRPGCIDDSSGTNDKLISSFIVLGAVRN